jgi:hypothetical protein
MMIEVIGLKVEMVRRVKATGDAMILYNAHGSVADRKTVSQPPLIQVGTRSRGE